MRIPVRALGFHNCNALPQFGLRITSFFYERAKYGKQHASILRTRFAGISLLLPFIASAI
jgi:hypothetical protein